MRNLYNNVEIATPASIKLFENYCSLEILLINDEEEVNNNKSERFVRDKVVGVDHNSLVSGL